MSKRKQTARRAAARRRRILQIAVGAGIIGVSTLIFVLTRQPKAEPVPPERATAQMSRGPEDAPVTITEYGDFNCPSCKAYHQAGIIARVLSEHPGEVRFVFRHFPVITAASPRLAEAAECAYDQGAFWEFHDRLYAVSPSAPGDMPAIAKELGLDEEAFQQCYDSRQYAGLVDEQLRAAYGFGFRGTPSFTINDLPLAGPPSYEQLSAMVASLLSDG